MRPVPAGMLMQRRRSRPAMFLSLDASLARAPLVAPGTPKFSR
jgi:hypothetical protein